MWLIVYIWCVEKGLKACWIVIDVISCLYCCELCNAMKMGISSLFVWTCHLHYFDTWLWQVLCALRKNENLKRMYHFEGRNARHNSYYYSRVVSCTATDAWTDMSPVGLRLRDSGCVSLGQTCIIILYIILHILIIGELDIVFCWSCDCLSAEFVIDNTELDIEDM